MMRVDRCEAFLVKQKSCYFGSTITLDYYIALNFMQL